MVCGATLCNISCIKEESYLDSSTSMLQFSTDTLTFDTVFVSMGTTTRQVIVHNPFSKPVLLEEVKMQNANSCFRMNVDGDTSRVARNVVIEAFDSIFIFIQATINPNNLNNPFLIEDAIQFTFANHTQQLPVIAYGRNAVYHLPTDTIHYSDGSPLYDALGNIYAYSKIDCTNWRHDLPHVFLGYAVVDEDSVLNLEAGDELYFANNSILWVFDGGKLIARGSAEAPVKFTSIRHDWQYSTLPGQWGYIWLSGGSRDNVMDWCVVENSYVGLLVDSCVNQNPTVDLSNTIIRNQEHIGILAEGAHIHGDNLLLHTCGTSCLYVSDGGRYTFSNSTIANYFNFHSRRAPAVVLNNWYEDVNGHIHLRPLHEAIFQNCIIYGTYSNKPALGEILFDKKEGSQFNVSFSHCLLRSDLIDSTQNPTLLVNRDPLFLDATQGDYHLQKQSPALGRGNADFLTRSHDLENQTRMNPPAIGAYEYLDTNQVKSHPVVSRSARMNFRGKNVQKDILRHSRTQSLAVKLYKSNQKKR